MSDLFEGHDGDTPPPPATKLAGRRMRWLRRSAIMAGALVATLVVGGAVYLVAINSNIERSDLMTKSFAATPQSAKGALNIVIMGSGVKPDQDTTSKGDVVMVLHISTDRKSAALVSFPRGLAVDVPGEGLQTLNSTYALGGSKLTVATLEKLLNTRMDHAMIADYAGFEKLAQEVGAIKVDNPSEFKNGGFSYAKGTISLDGLALQEYVEPYAGDGDGDKELRQRMVLEAGMQKAMSRSTLSSPTRLNRFVRTATSNVTVDKSFTAAAIAKIASSLDLNANNITLVRAPMSDKPTKLDGDKVYKVDKTTFPELVVAMSQDKMPDYIDAYGKN